MRIITGSEMKRLDAWAIEQYGIPAPLLMENAGAAVARKAQQVLGDVSGRKVLILVGKGNNGGDALVAARHLYELGAEVKLFLLFTPEHFTGATLDNWRLVEKLPVKWRYLGDENSFHLFRLGLNQAHLVIDGIFGTGFKGKPDGNIARVMQAVNEGAGPVLAIDIPSGLDADSGKVEKICIKAHYTVTFAWAKRGLVLFPGRQLAGELEVAGITLPGEALNILEKEEYYVDGAFARGLLPARDWEGHKNSFGHVLVIAGSAGMTGAALLASRAVLRSGAGMVTACLPCSLVNYFDVALPEAITRGVDETPEKTIASSAWPEITRLLQQKKAVVFGPGLTARAETREVLVKLLSHTRVPLVIDADGLNVLAEDPGILKAVPVPVILTPHPGEMGRLLGISAAQVQADRVQTAREAALRLGAVVVLKGAATVTATPQGCVYINSTGNPALATAGTGDVLAGAIGGLLAQGLAPPEAAVLGVFAHGLAGDLVAREKGLRGVLAGDVVEALPLALKTLDNNGVQQQIEREWSE